MGRLSIHLCRQNNYVLKLTGHEHLMHTKYTLSSVLCVMFSTCLLWCGPAYPAQSLPTGNGGLLERYHEIEAELMSGEFGIPIYLESLAEQHSLRGDVYGIIRHPFETVRDMLVVPATWCDIAPLHLNIKACIWRQLKNRYLLTFFTGRKWYQPPEDAYQLDLEYRVIAQQPNYLRISLTADNGPMSTQDYRIELEAMPADERGTILHFSYAYRYGFSGWMAMKAYFATLGRGKVGFTMVNTDGQGNPVYVGSIRGMIERNVVRYYRAIQAYLDTHEFPQHERFTQRISQWYDLTDLHRKQLYEMNKEEYLECKRREHENQLILQRELTGSIGK